MIKRRYACWLMLVFLSLMLLTIPTAQSDIGNLFARFDQISKVLNDVRDRNSMRSERGKSDFQVKRHHIYTKILSLDLMLENYFALVGIQKERVTVLSYPVVDPTWDVLEAQIHAFIDKLEVLAEQGQVEAYTKKSVDNISGDSDVVARRIMNALVRLERRLDKIGLPPYIPSLVLSRADMLHQVAQRLCKKASCNRGGYKFSIDKNQLILPVDVLKKATELAPAFNDAASKLSSLNDFTFQMPAIEATIVNPEAVFIYLNTLLGDGMMALNLMKDNAPLKHQFNNRATPIDVYEKLDETLFLLKQVAK